MMAIACVVVLTWGVRHAETAPRWKHYSWDCPAEVPFDPYQVKQPISVSCCRGYEPGRSVMSYAEYIYEKNGQQYRVLEKARCGRRHNVVMEGLLPGVDPNPKRTYDPLSVGGYIDYALSTCIIPAQVGIQLRTRSEHTSYLSYEPIQTYLQVFVQCDDSLDGDSDGVTDCLDECPDSVPERRKYVDDTGCIPCRLKIDADRDRVQPGGIAVLRTGLPGGLQWRVAETRGKGVSVRLEVNPEDDSEAVLSVDPGSGEGSVMVEAVDTLAEESCVKTRQIIIGCECIDCDAISLDSLNARFSLGKMSGGNSAGELLLYAETMSPDLATPAALKLVSPSPEVTGMFEGGTLRQVSCPEYFVQIIPESTYRYAIHYYRPEDRGSRVHGYYEPVPGAVPLHTWTIENPDAPDGGFSRLLVRKFEDQVLVMDNEYIQNADTWTLIRGGGLSVVSLSGQDRDGLRIETRTVQSGDGRIASVVETTWQAVGDGLKPVLRRVDPEGADLTTRMTYYKGPDCPGILCGRLKQQTAPDGARTHYTYDPQGRVSVKTESWLDQTPDPSGSGARVIYYDYAPRDPQDAAAFSDARRPRQVTNTVNGQTVENRFFSFRTDESGSRIRIEEVCLSPQGAFGDTENLRWVTVHYPYAPGRADSAEIKSIRKPDDTLESHTYVYGIFTPDPDPSLPGVFTPRGGHWRRETITDGTVTSPEGVASRSTRRIRISDPLGRTVLEETQAYIGTDYFRVSWTFFAMDDQGRETDRYHSDGTRIETEWTCCGKRRQTDRTGVTTVFSHDPLQRVTARSQASESGDITRRYTYDASGRVLTEIVSAGNLDMSRSTEYDGAGRLAASVDFHGLITRYRYDDGGRTTTMIRPGGGTVIVDKYLDGRIRQITGTGVVNRYFKYGVNSDGSRWILVSTGTDQGPDWEKTFLDMAGRTVRVEKPGFSGTESSRYRYNTLGQLIRVETDGLTQLVFEYNDLGTAIRAGLDINANRILDGISMDRIARSETFYIKKDGDLWRETRDTFLGKDNKPNKSVLSITRERLTGLETGGVIRDTRTVDGFGGITATTDVLERATTSLTTTTDYPFSDIDGVETTRYGLLKSKTDSTGITITYGHDALGRPISVTHPRTGTTTMDYNAAQQPASIQDPASNRTTYTYDPASGRIVSETDALDGTRYYRYNDLGLITRSWGHSCPVRYEYDDQGRRVKMYTYRTIHAWDSPSWPSVNDVLADETRWRYHPGSGLLAAKEDAEGKMTWYTYLPGGRLASRTWARTDGTFPLVTTYTYDPGTGELTAVDYSDKTPDIGYVYNRAGKLTQVTDAAGRRTFSYNDFFQQTTETITGIMDRRLSMNYDTYGKTGRTKSVTMDNSYRVEYGYAPDGRLDRIGWDVLGMTDSVAYTYEPNARVPASKTFDSGSSVLYTYDPVHDVKTSVANWHHQTLISRYDYTCDALSRHNSMAMTGTVFDQNRPVIPSDPDTGLDLFRSNTTDYTTNPLNQYIRITRNGRISEPVHDPDGNLTDARNMVFTWNAENRLTGVAPVLPVTGDQKLEFVYDYLGRRIQKSVFAYHAETGTWHQEKTVGFVYDGWQLVEERVHDNSNDTSRFYVWGMDLSGTLKDAGGVGGLLARIDEPGNRQHVFFHDAGGNVGQMIDALDGAVKASYEYCPFGNVIRQSGDSVDDNPFRFSTRYQDDETGLLYYGYRYYSPVTGRWINRDPLNEPGNVLLRKKLSNSMPSVCNPYEFCWNDPVNRLDPLGLFWFRQDWQTKSFVGRKNTIVPTGGRISRFIEYYVPAGYTFGQLHDMFVGNAVAAGLPDQLVNIPSMLPMYQLAQLIETLRSLRILEQPSPLAESVKKCKKTNSVMK
ncbi:MAG: RHS repeat-associated core domain-containing protein [Desulfotignum sp.]|nr:RHS repeat-associated core domain-containing protein [Desulfotignum sp.]